MILYKKFRGGILLMPRRLVSSVHECAMKGSSSNSIEKQFSCDSDGCLVKFNNEDHVSVSKKRHDMVLNLGLGQKGNFTDQTPTPTRFIRNCEEVGLFQDLQNVNPFEETFRKAVEAVKTGQTPLLEKSFQSAPTDDTLHTPNVFPHITDFPVRTEREILQNDREPSNELSSANEIKTITNDEKLQPLNEVIQPQRLILGNINHKKRKNNNVEASTEVSARENVSDELLVSKDFIGRECEKIIHSENEEFKNVQIALKEKIRKNLDRQIPVVLQLKIPIPKSTSSVLYQKSEKDRFSTFTRNSLKFEQKLEKPQSGIFDLSQKKRVKKAGAVQSKERLEILERNRAAATRCREKKKIYMSYLEKLNRELKEANKNLQLHNMSLRKEIEFLRLELQKHSNCSLAGETAVVTSAENGKKLMGNMAEGESRSKETKCNLETEAFEIVEVSLSEENEHHSSCTDNKSTETQEDGEHTSEMENLRKVYTDHSYFNYSNALDVRKRLINLNLSKTKLDFMRDYKIDCNDYYSVDDQNISSSKISQPLILMKPFNKRRDHAKSFNTGT